MNAVHVHLIINHAPLFGLIAGVVLLGWGVLRRSYEVRLASYVAFILSALAAIAVYLTGGAAESLIEDLPGVTESAIERHEDIAKMAMLAIGATGLLAAIAFLVERSGLALRRSVLAALLVVAFLALGVVGYAANVGGQIRHTEITAHQ
jgi:drug/metabolite transporter (DMT)-like permease